MPICPLPSDPSFENLKKKARALLTALRWDRAEARELVREFHPRAKEVLAAPKLADAQLVLARRHGFASWPELKRHLGTVERFTFDPPEPLAPGASEPLADAFVRHACVNYGSWHPDLARRAEQMLAEHPELARTSLHVAAAAGDLAAAREWLARDSSLLEREGGVLGWEPLLYACYSRVGEAAGRSTFEVARLLVERGADPNAGFLWRGLSTPFTALTGAFGEGEDGENEPPHPRRDELARLLLEAGADPNDGQTLYNKHFRADDSHLRLLFEYGLGRDRHGPWFARLGAQLASPARMLVEELWAAAGKGYAERVRLLVEHGTDVDARGFRDGRTPYEAALLSGNREIAEYLARHGAKRIELSPAERLASACVAGDRDEVQALLRSDPTLLDALERAHRAHLLERAVESNQMEGLRLMAELGFDLSVLTRNTPLHNAAWAGNLPLVRLLVELGADPTVREPAYDGTPLGWANHNQQPAVVEYLLQFADVFDAVEHGAVERVAELLEEDPTHANARDARGAPLVFKLLDDPARAPDVLTLLVAHGADLDATDRESKTAAERAQEQQNAALVELLIRHGAKRPQREPRS